MPFGEPLLDALLARQQPVRGLVEIVFIGGAKCQHFAQTGTGCFGLKAAGGGELGLGFDDAGDDHGDGQIALSVVLSIQEVLQPQLP